MIDGELPYPLEFVIEGTPVSLQSKNTKNRETWKQIVRGAALERRQELSEFCWLDQRALGVRIYYFSPEPMVGDIDNIVKPILDAMIGVAYPNDQVIEQVVVQKFEPDTPWEFASPTGQLAIALDTAPPLIYIRVDDDLRWRKL
ncbi:RusA family crossover junction endodeoxyribonuclease [Caulobacter vibrioides]|uniref:RusA family crossover junction endodeoxyribonuclease n=1 Tax=Caulobacter vibrioides TaxID=155892 RepID=UPI000BB51495|nr:RusA family crossover junction endodeoxyribonuclease [Caulobacter vibrioides]ATC26064.1 RusA family crossover junction endodeoxyribonuclease [Caulobacter vibrioides]PLR16813.1 RusA family crossover junction endodeoxyribonuclease [Caulobacter vibrioides]